MASYKEISQTQHASRPLNHRPSLSSTSASGGLAPRQSHSRTSSHSVTATTLNANHRVSRRKSMTNTVANTAAVAAALKDGIVGAAVVSLPILGGRRNTISKSGVSRSAIIGSLPSPPASLPLHQFALLDGKLEVHDSAIDDSLYDMSDEEDAMQQAHVRRASDGQPLVKESRKFNRIELHCKECGKGYKHSSCLNKHMWEHSPQWALTSKLLISKHQQVQLLEAATVLVSMNDLPEDAATPPDSARDFGSDQDSSSPAASGYSDAHDGRSSADTTPPPQAEGLGQPFRSSTKRHSSGSGFSRSYQSAPSAASLAGSAPNGSGFSYLRRSSQDVRPTSSGKNATGQDDQDLASGLSLLSCSNGSNSGKTVHLPDDAPPVPPVPAQYLDQAGLSSSYFGGGGFASKAPESFTRGGKAPESFTRGDRGGPGRVDSKMDESRDSTESPAEDDDDDTQSRARSDDDDDGVFGRMEE